MQTIRIYAKSGGLAHSFQVAVRPSAAELKIIQALARDFPEEHFNWLF